MDETPFLGLLNALCGELEAAGLKYALTGSVVSSIYGEPYTSTDVDVCLRMTPAQAGALAASLPPRFYEPREDTGWTLAKSDFEKMLDEYYAIRGWDSDGKPTGATLDRLGIEA